MTLGGVGLQAAADHFSSQEEDEASSQRETEKSLGWAAAHLHPGLCAIQRGWPGAPSGLCGPFQ